MTNISEYYGLYYYGNVLNNGAGKKERPTLATIQRLKGNGQFREARAKECNSLYNYATNISLDKIQTI